MSSNVKYILIIAVIAGAVWYVRKHYNMVKKG